MSRRKDRPAAAQIGVNVRRLRLHTGLPQTELAARIRVSSETIGRIERGHVFPSVMTVAAIAAALGTSTDEILRGIVSGAVPPSAARPMSQRALSRAPIPRLITAVRSLNTLADDVEREWRERYQLPATEE